MNSTPLFIEPEPRLHLNQPSLDENQFEVLTNYETNFEKLNADLTDLPNEIQIRIKNKVKSNLNLAQENLKNGLKPFWMKSSVFQAGVPFTISLFAGSLAGFISKIAINKLENEWTDRQAVQYSPSQEVIIINLLNEEIKTEQLQLAHSIFFEIFATKPHTLDEAKRLCKNFCASNPSTESLKKVQKAYKLFEKANKN